ncbi:hypothetical protein Tco_1399744 [Tanacetum coccineum]
MKILSLSLYSGDAISILYQFDPFFGLDSQLVAATIECVDKAKWVALDDDQVPVADDIKVENETEDENRDDDTSDSDELVNEKNELVNVAVVMYHFDRVNANTMGNEDTPEFNADEEFDINIDVIDNEVFESASDENGINRIRKRKLKQLKKQS